MAIYTKTGDMGETGLLDGRRLSKGNLQMSVIGVVDELNSRLGFSAAMMDGIRNQFRGQGGWENVDFGLAKVIGQLRDVQRSLFEIGAALAAENQDSGFKIKDKKLVTDEDSGKLEPRKLAHMAEDFLEGKRVADEESKNENVREESKEISRVDPKELVLDVGVLESEIDEMERELPRLKNFILPGGGVAGAQLMVARSVCRRAERELVRYVERQGSRKQKGKEIIRQPQTAQSLRPAQDDKADLKSLSALSNTQDNMLMYLNRLSDYLFVASRWVNWLMKEEELVWRKR